ncbi:MAG: Na+/H+ antiporter NhaA [Dehalococcoidia bacterium]|nr:Na+/H+ antiporter NhaA [Dehalococcoidia bacterium]
MSGASHGQRGSAPGNGGRRFAAARLVRPIQAFVHTEASSGILLLAAAVVAILWANSPWDGAYNDLWHAKLRLDANLFVIDEDLGHLVNDGLMAIFFFVVGLEIKREVLHGELASPRRAALPIAGAIGGMVVPALIYVAFNAGHDGAKGWGIPMATDIAFSLGVLALLGRRVPFALKVFLLALAIVDDLGAIVVIAVFYTDSISTEALLWAGVVLAVIIGAQRGGVRSTDVYVVLGFLFWAAVLKSGIHATIAGVVLAFLTPAAPYFGRNTFEESVRGLLDVFRRARDHGDRDGMQSTLSQVETLARQTESPLDRLERQLHPWVSYLIVPVFALANAGVVVSGDTISDAFESRVTAGVAFGLVLGKPIGIFLFALLAVRMGIASLPSSVSIVHLFGVGMLAGIGFTVSLFITGLAFESAELVANAKMGVLGGSVVAGTIAFLYLWFAPGEPERERAAEELALDTG